MEAKGKGLFSHIADSHSHDINISHVSSLHLKQPDLCDVRMKCVLYMCLLSHNKLLNMWFEPLISIFITLILRCDFDIDSS